jgi:hypothetical protein
MPHAKCAGCRWEARSGEGCTMSGVSTQKIGEKKINRDTPETTCMPTPGPQAAQVCMSFVCVMQE